MNWQDIVKQNNLDVSEIKLSQIAGRIDPEYYSLEYLGVLQRLETHKTIKLRDFCSITASAFYPAATQLYSQGDIPFVRCVDCVNFPVISKEQADSFEKVPSSFVKKNKNIKEIGIGDIVITKVGTPCYASIISDLSTVALSRTVLGLKGIKDVNSYYLLGFLRSKYGFSQLMRERELTIQYQLTLERTGNVEVALPSVELQNEIEKVIKHYFQTRIEAKTLYSQAEKLLLAELGLSNYISIEANTASRDLIECLQYDRFDAEYWMPKYDEMQKRVANVPQIKLGQLVNHKKGIEVGSEAYQEEGEDFIRIADFSIYGIEGVEKKISRELYENLKKNYQPKKGEVLFTKDGTIGLSYALDEDVKGVLSGAFLRLQPKTNINIHYLALVLNSLYCKYQIERMSGGAIISHLKPESAMQINIPILPPNRQIGLGNMVIQSLQKRKEAKALLEKAKTAVEIFVEQDEETALTFLR